MGIAISGVGAALLWRTKTPGKIEESAREDFGIKITFPGKERVPKQLEVRGIFKKKLPKGIRVLVIDYSVKSERSYFKRVPVLDEKLWEWKVPITPSGNPEDERVIKVATMGPDGLAFCKYVEDVSSQISKVWDKLREQGIQIPHELYTPGVKDLPPDIIVCDAVGVTRG